MKAVMLTDLRRLELQELDQPAIVEDTDVLLKLEWVGVCGSDVHYFVTGRIGSQVVQFPYLVGHECAATVAEIGSATDRVKPGDPVVVDPAWSCGQCDQCRAGRENTCRNLRFLGTPGQGDGCLREYMVMSQQSLFPTNGGITPQQAVLTEPLSIGVYAVERSGMTAGNTVAILGAGPVGLCTLLAARAAGAGATYITDKIAERVAAAQGRAHWVGNPDQQDIVSDILQHEPQGVDIVHECAGQQETIYQAVELLKPGGTLMVTGIPAQEHISFIIDRIRRKEITIINVRRQNHCVQKTIDLVAAGDIDVDFMVTHEFDLAQAQEAFELVAEYRDGVIKALIRF